MENNPIDYLLQEMLKDIKVIWGYYYSIEPIPTRLEAQAALVSFNNRLSAPLSGLEMELIEIEAEGRE